MSALSGQTGYALYVWASFVLTGLVLAGLVALSLYELKKRRRALDALARARRDS